MRTPRSGFSLLELMIGMIIVTILASIAIPSFSKAIEKTKVKDAQTTLAALYSSEKIYRLDQTSYGTLTNLVSNNYISDPDPSNNNTNWDFSATVGGAGSTFTATATRTGGAYNGKTVTADETFTGTNYGGNHPLKN